ncbi:MAG TPA: glycosyltransferase [bacterium]|nr:glycosyltransferase [bacterium]HPQ67346.1 glycosyltransferase [bacterium]
MEGRIREDVHASRRESTRRLYDRLAPSRARWISRNRYYYRELAGLLEFLIEPGRDLLQIGCGNGFLLSRLDFASALGIDFSPGMIEEARRNVPEAEFMVADVEFLPPLKRAFDYILMVNVIGDIVDVQKAFENLLPLCRPSTRLVVVYYNHLWEPLVKLAERLGMKIRQPNQNWLSPADISNLLYLAGFELVRKDTALLLPFGVPGLSFFLNRFLARLPLFNHLCFVNAFIARPLPAGLARTARCSVVVPCKDEVGNVGNVLERIPEMGAGTEVVFVDDRSSDGTAAEVERLRAAHPDRRIVLVSGPGRGKFEAVKAGFAAAGGDVLMILDADATVMPEELPLFFNALVTGKGEFVNGCRLVYEMEKGAMRLLNIVGNKLFGLAFSYLLSQRIKDTLCGTKVFFREDYLRMKRYFGFFGYDSWGDFNLLFSACKLGMKIVDLPIHYVERVSGETKMKRRFSHGWTMLRMCLVALKRFKFRL